MLGSLGHDMASLGPGPGKQGIGLQVHMRIRCMYIMHDVYMLLFPPDHRLPDKEPPSFEQAAPHDLVVLLAFSMGYAERTYDAVVVVNPAGRSTSRRASVTPRIS